MPTKIAVWSAQVIARDRKCLHCASTRNLHAFRTKGNLTVENGITLCHQCRTAAYDNRRPTRSKANRPQRKTLLKMIHELQKKLDDQFGKP